MKTIANPDQQNQMREVKKPKPYYAAQYDVFGNPFNQDNEQNDYRIREVRDIDDGGLFMAQRVFQPHKLNRNLAGIFTKDFVGYGDLQNNNDANRFDNTAFSRPIPRKYMPIDSDDEQLAPIKGQT